MIDDFEIRVPMIPPSVNHYWKVRRGGGRYITAEGEAFKKIVKYAVLYSGIKIKPELFLKLEINFISSRWITKKGTVALKDCDNLVKCAQDSVCEALGINDSQIFHLIVKKVVSKSRPKEGETLFKISEIDPYLFFKPVV